MNLATLPPPPFRRMGGLPSAGSSGRIYGRDRLNWRRCPDGSLALHCEGIRDALVHVVPDAKHDDMWRIAHPDGCLSDMANLTRAKDAASGVALGILNRRAELEAA